MEQLKTLYNEQLFSNCLYLGNLLKSACEHNPDLLTPIEKYQFYAYYGEALFQEQEYKRAEAIFEKALQFRKSLLKGKLKMSEGQNQPVLAVSIDDMEGLPSECDIKYRIHECLCQAKNIKSAIAILETISAKQRKPKVNMALAKLYQRVGKERAAITGYKEVLRQCPLALEAVLGLLSLGLKGTEVAALVSISMPTSNQLDWFTLWLKGHAYSTNKEYSKAVSTFKNLETDIVLRENSDVLCNLAENHFLSGDLHSAEIIYQRVHSLNPDNVRGMDIYAYLLSRNRKTKELQSLACKLMEVNNLKAEPWIAMGYRAMTPLTNKSTRAVYFAQKACQIDSTNVQAILLKGSALKELNKTIEATLHFREAVRLAPHRFEAHQGLVDCYVQANRIRDAVVAFHNSCKVLGNTPRTLTTLASLLAKDRMSIDKAKPLLEKALVQDPTYLEAVYLLADVLTEQDKVPQAMDLLKKHMENQSTSKLHQKLGDLMMKSQDVLGALDQYGIAISLDPSNKKAVQGLQRAENVSDLPEGAEDDMEVIEETSEEADFDQSDQDSEWVETEPEWLT